MPDISKLKAPATNVESGLSPEVVLGELVGVDDDGSPIVDWTSNRTGSAQRALTASAVSRTDIGQPVALLFVDGDPACPVIVGKLRRPLDQIVEVTEQQHCQSDLEPDRSGIEGTDHNLGTRSTAIMQRDNERLLVVDGQDELTLRCGAASITLTRSGKILLRGTHIVSRSSGENKIKGASIQLN